MPNHIKNRIELFGAKEKIESLVKEFSTSFERTPSKAHYGTLIYTNKKSGEVGWLNESNGEFTQRDKPPVVGVPDGFEQDFEDAWVRFPDFNKLIPMPEELNIASSSVGEIALNLLFGHSERFDFLSLSQKQQRIKEMDADMLKEEIESGVRYWNNIKSYGFKTWYDWSVENWGTKWNAYSCEKVSPNIYDFETAWSGVPDLIELLSKKNPDVRILYKYSDEDTGSNCGIGEYLNGRIEFNQFESQSKEAYELAFELRPDRKENYHLVGDKYEYVEED